MNTPPPDPAELELKNVLKTWRVELADDPALARKVWARIEAGQAGAGERGFNSWLRLLTRPVGAIIAVATFAVIGALAAEMQRETQHEARVDRLAIEYAQSIDPLLMALHTEAGHVR